MNFWNILLLNVIYPQNMCSCTAAAAAVHLFCFYLDLAIDIWFTELHSHYIDTARIPILLRAPIFSLFCATQIHFHCIRLILNTNSLLLFLYSIRCWSNTIFDILFVFSPCYSVVKNGVFGSFFWCWLIYVHRDELNDRFMGNLVALKRITWFFCLTTH